MEQRILGFARRNVKRALGLLMALMLLFGLLPAVSFAAYTIGPNPSTYAARPDQNTAPRPAYLAGSFFSTPGAGLVVYDAAGDRKVIPFTNTSSDWNTSKLLMDCVSSDWGYYRVTLYLPAGGYQFKVYQENAVGGKLSKVSADKWNYWFGLDGYIYSKWDWDGQYPWPGTDIYNNDPTGGSYGASADYNNVHIDLVEPDDVTFYFIDGTRSDFLEYAPNPSPWYANDNWRLNTTLDPAWGINGGRDARNAQIHYIAAYPEKQINRGPANDPDVVGLYDHFDWYRTHYPYDGSAHDRFRPFSTPFWFGIKRTMKSDTITSDTGIATGVRGDMFLFRRTDFLATGGIGNNDGGKAYYKNNTGDYYSNIVNSPYANISNPNGTNATTTMSGGTRTADGLRMDLWSSHATQLVDAAGNATNDMYFGSAVSANVAGVYTYYMDKVRFGKVGSSITEPYVNEAYDFTQGPRARYQAVYLPTIVLNTPPTGLNDESPIRFTGDSYGYNTDANTSNIVYGKLMGTTQTHYADMDMVKFGALQALVTSKGGTLTRVQNGDHADITLTFTTNASAANGEWQWPADGSTITLPKSEVGTVYTLDAYLEVVSTERLLDGKTLDSSGNEKWARNYSTAMSTYGANIQGTGDSQSIEGFINSLPAVNYATVNASAELATQHVFPHAGTVVSSDGKTHTRSSIETKTLTVVNRAPTVTGGVATGNKTLADTVTINVPTINITSTELDIWSGDADKPIIGLTTGTYTSPLHSYSVTVGALSGGVYPVRVGSNHIANIRLNTNANGVVISATLERVYRTSGIGVDSVPDFTVPLTVTDGWLSGANGSLRFRLDNQAPETDPADHYRKDGQSTTSTMHTDVQARDVKDNDPTGGDSVTVTSYSVSSSASVQRSCNATGTPNTALWTTIASYALNTGVNAGLMDFTVPSNIWYYNGSTWSPQDASWIGGAVLAGGGYSTMGIPVATPTQLANTVVFDLIVINVAIIDNDAFNPLSSSDPIRIHYGPAPTIDVNVTKVWAPMPAPAGITHPTSVQVQLLRDGDPYGDPVTLNSGNSWYHEWTELDPAFTWTVEEVSVPDGYTVSYGGDVTNGFIVTNTKTTDFTVVKEWQPSVPSGASVTFQLTKGGLDVPGKVITLSSAPWTHTWTDLPYGTDYGVRETAFLPGSYASAIGTPVESPVGSGNYTVTVTNTERPGSLVISKVVADENDTGTFTFTVKKNNVAVDLTATGIVITPSGTGTYTATALSSGTFTMTRDTTVTITGLTPGTDYTVTEVATGYTTTFNVNGGTESGSTTGGATTGNITIPGDGSASATFTNTIIPPPVGSLVISKVVADENDTGTFTFTVKKNNVAVDLTATGIVITPSGTGTYTATALSSGTFTMTRDTTVTITGLTPGTDYTVTEVATGYTTTFNVNGGTESGSTTGGATTGNISVPGDGSANATFTNTIIPPPVGSLVISKVVADENDTGTFTFTVKKNNVAVDLTATGIVITPSGTGTYTATALSSGTFTMTRDTTVTITGLTPGTDYTVTEVATGYTTTFNVNGGTESGSTTGGATTGNISVPGDGSANATFTNTIIPPPVGSLVISKVVADANDTGTFTFTVKKNNVAVDLTATGIVITPSGTGTYTATALSSGIFTMTRDTTVTITGLTPGTDYTVTEVATGYTTTFNVNGGTESGSTTGGATTGNITIPGDGSASATFTNTIIPPPTIDVTVIKLWATEGGEAPPYAYVDIDLYDGTTWVARVRLDGSETPTPWSYTWEGLPLPAVAYRVEEAACWPEDFTQAGDVDVATDNDGNITFTITNAPKTISITIIKVWDDGRNVPMGTVVPTASIPAPPYAWVDIDLYDGTTWVARVRLDGSETPTPWSYTWEGLPLPAVAYRVEEAACWPEDFTQRGDALVYADEDGNLTFTVINVQEEIPENFIDITVVKVWGTADGSAPAGATATIDLYNGTTWVARVILTGYEDTPWTHTWTGLDPDGDWSIDEAEWTPADFIKVEIIDKATDNDGNITFTVTNNPPPPPIIDITVVKVWGTADGSAPAGATATIDLYNGTTWVARVILTGYEDTPWTHTWTGLDPDGDWSIDEAEWTPADFIKVEIIDKATDNDGNITFTVTNNPPPPPPTINITVVKVWRGIAVADLPTGTTVTVKLYNKDGLYDTQTLSGPGWTYTWTGLSESDGPWSLEEVCPAGFLQVGNVGKATDNGGNITFTVTNEPEPEPELIDITVIKEWDIPTHVMLPPQASVTVQLYNGDTPVGPIVTLNADNDWTHTWEGMDADGDWSARELTLPKRFLLDEITMEVDEDGNITFTIVNIPDGSWERTGEGAWIWILGGVLLLALIGLAVLIFLRKRGKKAAPAQEAESLESTESEE